MYNGYFRDSVVEDVFSHHTKKMAEYRSKQEISSFDPGETFSDKDCKTLRAFNDSQ